MDSGDKIDEIEVDTLLWATGRHSNTSGLGLYMGVEVNTKGNIVVNGYQNLTAPVVSAIGDVAGHALLTLVAIATGI